METRECLGVSWRGEGFTAPYAATRTELKPMVTPRAHKHPSRETAEPGSPYRNEQSHRGPPFNVG
jgi:hypothetical protein